MYNFELRRILITLRSANQTDHQVTARISRFSAFL
jgi:hypothetical protein